MEKWGRLISHHPYIVIVLMTGMIVGLCFGVPKIILTTDPIELWSTEGSKVRNEKDFYDQSFGKFFRTEQVCKNKAGDL